MQKKFALPIEIMDLFPQRNTLDGIAEMKTGYTLLNLSPQELNSGSKKEADVTGQTLF